MEAYTPGEVDRINTLGGRLREGISGLLAKHGYPGEATGYGSFTNIHLTASGVSDYRSAARGDQGLQRLLHMALLLEGVFCAPRLLMCTSTVMTETIVDEGLAAVDRALARVRPAMSA